MSVEQIDIIVPSSPADREKIRLVIKKVSESKTRAEGEATYQREAIKQLSEDFDIKTKHLNKMAKEHHANSFDAMVKDSEGFQTLYESVMKTNQEVFVDED
jgi:hypothetical protein